MTSVGDAFKRAGYSEPSPGEDLPKDYTRKAKDVIKGLRHELGDNYRNFTTSKIRNILGMVSDIYNDVAHSQDEILSDEITDRIEYLKVRLIYECGREPKIIEPFVKGAGLIDIIDGIGSSSKKFIAFSRYMEALVAYHRYYGGKDH